MKIGISYAKTPHTLVALEGAMVYSNTYTQVGKNPISAWAVVFRPFYFLGDLPALK